MKLIFPRELVIYWHPGKLMMVDKTCLSCRNMWGMHHRCPALGGRWNCC